MGAQDEQEFLYRDIANDLKLATQYKQGYPDSKIASKQSVGCTTAVYQSAVHVDIV